jgi:hypothetical protein
VYSCYPHGCPCGFFGDSTKECRCTGAIIQRYLGKISGLLLDRIDLHIEVPAVPYQELRSRAATVTSAEMRDAWKRREQSSGPGDSTTLTSHTSSCANYPTSTKRASER